MSVRVGLRAGTSTVWFDASSRWYLRHNGLTVHYGETLDIEAELLARGTPSELRTALNDLRALVATVDRAGGQFLVDDGSAVEAFDVTRAELQDIAERLPFWSQGVARVVLRLTCSPESVAETGTTVAASVSAATGQPVTVDPGGRAELGVRLRATTDVLPAAAIAFALDGTYTASQLAPTLSSPVVQDAETYQTATYTAVARDLDVYVEVDDPPRDTGLGIDRVVAQPPYTVVLALAHPPNTVYGNFRAGDVVVVRGHFPGAREGWKGTLSTRAQVLSADAASVLLPNGTESVVVVRGVTLVDVLDVQTRERVTTYPGPSFTRNVPINVPGSGTRILVGVYAAGAAEYRYPKEGENAYVGRFAGWRVSGLPVSSVLVGGAFPIQATSAVTGPFTATVLVTLQYQESEFAWCDWWFTGSWAVLQVPSVSSLGGSYRVAVVSYDGTDPVGVVHWPTYVSVPANWELVVEFSDASPNATYKVFVQRAGSAQWYATTANPPRVVLSSLGTAESFPDVSATLASDLVTVSVVPSGVVQPRQELSAAFTPNGRRLVPLGRMFLIPNVDYDVTVRRSSAGAVRRVWFLPRPTVVTFGVATWRSALLETVRENGYRRTRGQPAAQAGSFIDAYGPIVTAPWLALRVTPILAPGAQVKALSAALPDGTGLVTTYNNAATRTHPDAPTALIWSSGLLAYLGEVVPAGTTIGALVFLYNTSTSNLNVTVYLYQTSTSVASQSLTVPAGQLSTVLVRYTPPSNLSAWNVRLSAPSSVYATVLWLVGATDLGQLYDGTGWRDVSLVYPTWAARFPGIENWLAGFDIANDWGMDSNQGHGWSTTSTATRQTDYGFYVGLGKTVSADAWVTHSSASARFVSHTGGVLASTSSTSPTSVSFSVSVAPTTVSFSVVPSSTTAATGRFRFLSIAGTSGPNASTQPVPLYGSSALTLSGPPAVSWAVAFRVALRSDYTGEIARIPLASGSPLIVTVSSTSIAVTRDSTTLASVARPTTPATILVGYSGGSLVLRAGQPGSWNSASVATSLPALAGGFTVSGTQGQGCAALRWAGYLENPSSAFLAGAPTGLGSDVSAYNVFAGEATFRYWNADDPNVLATEAGNLVDGVQRGFLTLNGPGTLIVFPVSDVVEQAIWERPFLLDVVAFPRR